jgi:hypothetical protein
MGTVYIWSIVYNIVRVYSSKTANEVKVDDYTISSDYALENDPENISKDRSQTDHVKQFEVECTNSNGRAEVPLNISFFCNVVILTRISPFLNE